MGEGMNVYRHRFPTLLTGILVAAFSTSLWFYFGNELLWASLFSCLIALGFVLSSLEQRVLVANRVGIRFYNTFLYSWYCDVKWEEIRSIQLDRVDYQVSKSIVFKFENDVPKRFGWMNALIKVQGTRDRYELTALCIQGKLSDVCCELNKMLETYRNSPQPA